MEEVACWQYQGGGLAKAIKVLWAIENYSAHIKLYCSTHLSGVCCQVTVGCCPALQHRSMGNKAIGECTLQLLFFGTEQPAVPLHSFIIFASKSFTHFYQLSE
jgi:hypothetical protein